jgi:hypothetical protein
MSHEQLDFTFGSAPHPTLPGRVPHLSDEIARLWGLPLGENIELFLLRGPCACLRGRLLLERSPDLPLNPRQALTLSISGIAFSSRDIEHWKIA